MTVITAERVIQRSTYNDNMGQLAIDGHLDTCSETGYDVGAWWIYDFGDSKLVSSVTIYNSKCLLI